MHKDKENPQLSRNDINPYPSFYTDIEAPVSGFSVKIHRVLEKGVIYSEGDLIATRSDLKSIPSNYFPNNNVKIKSKDFLNNAYKIFDLLKEELGEKAFQQENREETLKNISLALENAKIYLTEYLGHPLPMDVLKEEIKTDIDLINFLKKTKGLKPGAKTGLSPAYCAIVQIMRAEIEYQKEGFDMLEEDATWLNESLFAVPEKENEANHFIKTGKQTGDSWDQIVIIPDEEDDDVFMAEFDSRGKTHERVITKMLAKIKFDKKEAINDGIGLRLEITDNVETKILIPFLVRYFKEKFEATHLECRDNNFLKEEGVDYEKK